MSDLHFVMARFNDDIHDKDKPIDLIAATEKGTLRIIHISLLEAVKLTEDLARMTRILIHE